MLDAVLSRVVCTLCVSRSKTPVKNTKHQPASISADVSLLCTTYQQTQRRPTIETSIIVCCLLWNKTAHGLHVCKPCVTNRNTSAKLAFTWKQLILAKLDMKWHELPQPVPPRAGQREFKAIGNGGSAFSAAMLAVIEKIVGPVQASCITERPSSKGSYMSVTIGPVSAGTCPSPTCSQL